jgi:hypothetical protein
MKKKHVGIIQKNRLSSQQSLAKETEVVPERNAKTSSWMTVNEQALKAQTFNQFKKDKMIARYNE